MKGRFVAIADLQKLKWPAPNLIFAPIGQWDAVGGICTQNVPPYPTTISHTREREPGVLTCAWRYPSLPCLGSSPADAALRC